MVARIGAGGYFGEMSLLTGEPRTATVSAVNDAAMLEITADTFRRLAVVHPSVVEQIRQGKESAMGFLVGQAMKKSQGKANPKKLGEMIKRRLLNG